VVAADEPSRHAKESLQGISFGVDGYDVLRVTEEVGEALQQGPWFKNEGGQGDARQIHPVARLQLLYHWHDNALLLFRQLLSIWVTGIKFNVITASSSHEPITASAACTALLFLSFK
jgi:hypothetical protein